MPETPNPLPPTTPEIEKILSGVLERLLAMEKKQAETSSLLLDLDAFTRTPAKEKTDDEAAPETPASGNSHIFGW